MEKVLNLESNEHLFNILDGWIEKYNTPPKASYEGKQDATLSIELNYRAQDLLKRPDIITQLKEWTIENNKKIVIMLGCVTIVLTKTAIQKGIIYIRNFELGNDSSHFYQTNIDGLSKISMGTYYSQKNNVINIITETDTDALLSVDDNAIVETDTSIKSGALEDSTIKSTFNHIIEEYVQAKTQNADDSFIDENFSNELSIELSSLEDPIPSTEVIVETSNILSGTNGIEIAIPSSVRQTGLCPNYTSYSYFYGKWSRGTGQKALSEQWGAAGKPSANGIATLNGRYLVAVSPKFGSVGDNIDIVLTDGQVIPAMIADIKGVDATSEWGHVLTASGAVDIIEWEASGSKSEINLGTWRNVTVEKIVNYGKEIVPVYESGEETVVVDDEAQQYIELYSEIYGLNEEKIYQIIGDLTNNFSSESYRQGNAIAISSDIKTIPCSSKEMAILLCVRDIYHNPSSYGVTAEDLKGDTLYQSSSSYAQQIEYLSNILGVDSDLNYAICQAACDFNSPMFINKHNPTSIMINGNYATFPTVTAGFVEQTVELLKTLLNGEDPIKMIGTRISDTPDSWNAGAEEIYKYVANNYDVVFGTGKTDHGPKSNQKHYILTEVS